jgi:hypothetical protein
LLSRALIIAAIAGLTIIAWVVYLYRKGRLKEDFAILWISVSVIIVLLSTWTDLLLAVNWVVDTQKNSEVVLAAFIAFLLIICIYYSIKLSQLAEQNKKLAQEIAIIKTAYNTLDRDSEDPE